MKNYLNFTAPTRRFLLPVWGMLICSALFVTYSMEWNHTLREYTLMGTFPAASEISFISLAGCLYVLSYWLLALLLMRNYLHGVLFRNQTPQTNYHIANYLWVLLSGFILTTITFGIYYPWFKRQIIRFFTSNATYDGKPFRFEGKGSTLFCIYTFVLIIPGLLLFLLGSFASSVAALSGSALFIALLPIILAAALLLYALYIYMYLKWIADFSYSTYHIRLQTNGFSSVLLIYIQILFSGLTLGLYLPIAGLVIYRILANHLQITSAEEEPIGNTEYTGALGKDILYLYGQTALTVITSGIYSPWALVRISRRLFSNTCIELPDEVPVAPTPTDYTPHSSDPSEQSSPSIETDSASSSEALLS